MKYLSKSYFDLALESVKDKKYVVLHDNDDHVDFFVFDEKEEFENEFKIVKHKYYPHDMVIPKHIIEKNNNYIDCIINGQNYYLDINKLYLKK